MRTFVYFIERIDTKEWYYVKNGFENRSGIVGDMTVTLIPSWTIDPLQSKQFDSKQMAEDFLEWDTVFDRTIKCEITEHEFVFIRQD